MSLISPVDAYRETDRTIKYGIMFIGLTFAACMLFEMATGTQPHVAQYNIYSMELLASVLKELDAIPEGDGTLLDHSLVMAFTDQAYARIHSVDGLPILVAGGASGRMKTGYHIAGDNSPVSRVGLTLQKALGVSVDTWGRDSLLIRSPYTELLA